MFAKTIVLSDAFLDMPLSTRCLYFTLGMMADDDGFVNSPKSIIRQTGASEDDIKLLIAKKFILPFESGLIVIKHWRINNYLRNDRYSETKYIDEKCQLLIEDNGAYTFGIPSNGIPSIDKDRLDNISSSAPSDESTDKPIKVFEHDSNPYKCASFLASKIKERVPNKKIEERTIQQWACEIEKINRIDGQEWKTISAVLDFSQKDAFWSKNVLSGANLRKNFDRLYLKMQEDT